MTSRKQIVVVGSINMDLVARAARIPVTGETVQGEEFRTHPGGKGANQAVAVARLGYPVSIVGGSVPTPSVLSCATIRKNLASTSRPSAHRKPVQASQSSLFLPRATTSSW